MTKLNKNDRVRLTDIDTRLDSFGLWLNQEGTVVSTRNLSSDDGEQILVDFDGYNGHIALDRKMVQILNLTYTIEVSSEQRELLHRAIDHLNNCDLQYHDDLVMDEDPEQRTALGKELELLTQMMDPNKKQDPLEPSPYINGLCF